MFSENQIKNDLSKQQNITTNKFSNEILNDVETSLGQCNISNNNQKIKNTIRETKKENFIFSFAGEENVGYNYDDMEFMDSDHQFAPLKSVSKIEEFNFGKFNIKCSFSGSLHFQGEANAAGLFKSCCDFGKVKLQSN